MRCGSCPTLVLEVISSRDRPWYWNKVQLLTVQEKSTGSCQHPQQQQPRRTCSSGVMLLAAAGAAVTASHRFRLDSTVVTAAPLLAAWSVPPLCAACSPRGREILGAPMRKPPTKSFSSQNKRTEQQVTEARGGAGPRAITHTQQCPSNSTGHVQEHACCANLAGCTYVSRPIYSRRSPSWSSTTTSRARPGSEPCFRASDKGTWLLRLVSAASLEPWLRYLS